jgi:hypothetical protein
MRVIATAVLAAALAITSRPLSAQVQRGFPAVRSAGGAPEPGSAATAVRLRSEAPRIDGRLDDPAWAVAQVLSDFVQRDPDEGMPASQRTEVRVIYTDEALYFGVRAFDTEAERISGRLTRRDEDSPSDWIGIGIDSYHDRRTAFVFWVNPVGVKRDVYLFNDTDSDDSWDAVWDVAATRDSEGWSAEFRIPFSQLRFAAADAHTFGLQVHRRINRNNEVSMWRLVPRNANGQVSMWGELQGLHGLRPPRRLEVMPYTVARGERSQPDAANPFNDGRTGSLSAGADIKYGLTSNLTLDVAINPDFGQVEQDPAFVNLSAFEQFQRERRPFFTEGAGIFRFPILLGDGDGANEQLFYSRRIGRAPQAHADPRGGYAEPITNTTILGAAKLSGRTPGGWTIGLLGAVTAEEEARVLDAGGQPFRDVVEPRSTYLAGRLARDLREGRTVVGLFGTALHRDLPGQLSSMRSDAYAGALDFNHRFAGNRYRIRGWFAASHVRGSEEAMLITQRSSARYFQQPDNSHRDVDSSLRAMTGFASQLSLGDEAGDWRWSVGYDTRSPEFEVNDMGYQREADYFQQFAWLQRRWLTPGAVFRRFYVNLNQWVGWNYGGERTFAGGNVNANWQFLNYWGGYAGINRQLEGFNRSVLRGGPKIVRPPGINGWYGLYSDSRRRLQANLSGWFFAQEENDTRAHGFSVGMTWRPAANVQLSLSPWYDFNHDDWQYVATTTVNATTEYVLGELNSTAVGAGLRANVTFTPTLTLQAYLAPFHATGQYVAFKRLDDPRAARYSDRFGQLAGARYERDANGDVLLDLDADGARETNVGHPDFSYTSLRSNLVLRWEYRPGSTVFVVWQQGRETGGADGRFRLGDVGSNIVGTRPNNVFLVKFNYWLSL